jgi:predicted phosphodiesterase
MGFRDGALKAAALAAFLVLACLAGWTGCRRDAGTSGFAFVAVSDVEAAANPQYDRPEFFPGVCEAIRRAGRGDFLVAVGDISPPAGLDAMLRKTLGDDYPWHAVVGNHDVKEKHLAWIRSHAAKLPGPVHAGPKQCEQTTYSFDRGGAHFVILNEYYSGLSDAEEWSDVCPSLYDWLDRDLAENRGKLTFVFGHEPIAAIPDADSGTVNHEETNLSRHAKNAHRFWRLLRDRGVKAYVCGHTQTCSWAKLNGVWQINTGHAQGPLYSEVRTTFLRFLVQDGGCRLEVHRSEGGGEGPWRLEQVVVLN